MAEENVGTLTSGKVRFQGGPEVPARADLSGVHGRSWAHTDGYRDAAIGSLSEQ
jgi:hypothetical protein